MSLDLIPGKFYVIDTMAGSLSAGVVSGPHDDKAAAERDRLDCNIADNALSAASPTASRSATCKRSELPPATDSARPRKRQ